jgi:hypothetical protein
MASIPGDELRLLVAHSLQHIESQARPVTGTRPGICQWTTRTHFAMKLCSSFSTRNVVFFIVNNNKYKRAHEPGFVRSRPAGRLM